jgi:hypothetical protein
MAAAGAARVMTAAAAKSVFLINMIHLLRAARALLAASITPGL